MLPSFETDPALSSIKLVASDMDCTLLADDGTMPPHMEDRIRALDDAGIVFCAASGRPGYTLRAMFPGLEDHMAFLSDNGAAIFYRGETVFKDLMDPARVLELTRFTLEDGRGCPTVCGLDACYIRRCDEKFDSYFRTFYKNIVYMDDILELDADVNKYTVFFPDNDAEEVYAELYRDAWGGTFSTTNAGKMWIDIMNRHVDKGTGITRLCEHLGIDVADACALGDTYNDVQMLQTAGHAYLVANAEEHMHAHAGWMVPSNNDRGVAVAIDAILATHGA